MLSVHLVFGDLRHLYTFIRLMYRTGFKSPLHVSAITFYRVGQIRSFFRSHRYFSLICVICTRFHRADVQDLSCLFICPRNIDLHGVTRSDHFTDSNGVLKAVNRSDHFYRSHRYFFVYVRHLYMFPR